MFIVRENIMPDKREEDCPAAAVCDAVGNLRKSCIRGGVIFNDEEMRTQRCMAGIILLLAPMAGVKLPVPPRGDFPGGDSD
jgi:hypothetical protein